jgi:hypothetical protein
LKLLLNITRVDYEGGKHFRSFSYELLHGKFVCRITITTYWRWLNFYIHIKKIVRHIIIYFKLVYINININISINININININIKKFIVVFVYCCVVLCCIVLY